MFSPIDSATEPGAFALAPLVTRIHGVWLAAVHAQPVSVSTLSVTAPPDADTVEIGGVTVKRHGAASCETLTCEPLTSSVPLRDAGTPFGSTRYATVPLPCPLVVEVSEIQFTPLDASHVQSRVVDTVSVPLTPPAGAVGRELSIET